MSLSPRPDPWRAVPLRTPDRGNRAGAAALAAGLLGCVLALIPPTYGPAALLGAAAIGLGIAGRSRARRRVAGEGPAAGLGVLLGTLALMLPVVGLAIAATASDGAPPAARATGGPAGARPAAGTDSTRPASTRPATTRPGREPADPAAGTARPAGTGAGADPDPRTVGAPHPLPIDGRTAYTYADGLRIQVLAVRPVRFSRWSTAGPRAGAEVTLRITNGTAAIADLEFVRVELRYGRDGVRAPSVFDSTTGVAGEFDADLAVGASAVARFGFALPPGGSRVSVEVSPGWYYDATTFSGRLVR